MRPATPIYNEVRKLAEQLRDAQAKHAITARRKAGEKLIAFLSDDKNRRKLAYEAAPRPTGEEEESNAARRSYALQCLWGIILEGAINVASSAGSSGKGKGRTSKRTMDDVTLPFKLLQTCTRPDDVFGDDGLDIPKVSKQKSRDLLKFCLEMLDDKDPGVDRVEVEMRMLEMLQFICSNDDFVANFREEPHLRRIMEELEKRLRYDFEQENENAFALSAKTIASLFDTCRRIGIQMNNFVPGTLHIVAEWGRHHIHIDKIQPLSNALPHLFNLASCILDTCPDLSIGPMKEFGRRILSYCKRCYNSDFDNKIHKQALNDYFFSHILLAQFAGKLEGLASGDLGDLAGASLTNKQLKDILESVTNELNSFVSHEKMDGNIGPRKKSNLWRYYIWDPTNINCNKTLQLSGRLMACAQRLFLSSTGWSVMGGEDSPGEEEDENHDVSEELKGRLMDSLLERLKIPGPNEGEWVNPDYKGDHDLPVSARTMSPWMKYVAIGLLAGIRSEELAALEANLFSGSEDAKMAFKPIFDQLDVVSSDDAVFSPLSALAVIAVCADTFPSGECWSSSTFGNWHRLLLVEPNHKHTSPYYNCCNPDDLTFLLLLLGMYLEHHGSPQGDIQLQCWVLHAIQRLAESSSIICNNFEKDFKKLQHLQYAWLRIWNVLFDPDLRYQASTEVIKKGSLGDLVLTLIRDIITYHCTESSQYSLGSSLNKQASFIHENQCCLWNLPIFKRPHDIQSASPYEIICKVLSEAGLSNAGSDCIGSKSTQLRISDEGEPSSRRQRLVQFVLDCLGQTIKSVPVDGDVYAHTQHRTAMGTACLLSLVNGKGPDHLINYDDDHVDYMKFRSVSSSIQFDSERELRIYFTPLDIMQYSVRRQGWDESSRLITANQLEFQEMAIRKLWGEIEVQGDQAMFESPLLYHDSVSLFASEIRREHTIRRSCSSMYADFVSDSEATGLHKLAVSFIRGRLNSLQAAEENELHQNRTPQEESESRVSLKVTSGLISSCILSAKVELSLLLYTKTPHREVLKEILVDSASFVEWSCTSLSNIHDNEKLANTARGVVQICRTLADISCTFQLTLPPESLNKTAELCRSMLMVYAARNRQVENISTKILGTPRVTSDRGNSFDLLMDDDFEADEDIIQRRIDPAVKNSSSEDDDESSFENGKRKRKRLSHSDGSTIHKRGRHNEPAAALNPESAQYIASLLLILDPSPANCHFICESLLATELNLFPEDIKGDMDLRLCGFCANVLTQDDTFLYSSSEDEKIGLDDSFDASFQNQASKTTVAEKLFDIVNLVRVCASPSSAAYLFGNSEVVPLLQWNRRLDYGYNLSDSEAGRIVDILNCNKGIGRRPRLREKRIRACISAFETCNDLFRQKFENHFHNILEKSLDDICYKVRYSAYEAVSMALASSEEEKLLEVTEKILPPLPSEPIEEQDPFKAWFLKSVFCSIDDEGASKGFNADDARFVLEAESILCRSIIAGRMKNTSQFAKHLFSIIMISSSSQDLELLCFQSLEIVAILGGYESVEDMIDTEGEAIAKLWIENDQKDLPLILTAPEIVRAIIYHGGRKLWLRQYLVQEASEAFVERYNHIMVPLALFRSVASNPEEASIGQGQEQDINFLASDSNFKAICRMRFQDESLNEDEIVNKNLPGLLRRYLPNIIGLCLPIRKWARSGSHRSTCSKVFTIINSILSSETFESLYHKKAYFIVRSILDMIGKSELLSDLLPDCDEAYFDALISVIQKLPQKGSYGGDILAIVGTCATEVLLRGCSGLNQSNEPRKQMKNWFTIRLQCHIISCQIRKRDHNQLQLGFCIHVLTEAILKTVGSPVRSLVFPVLIDLLKDAFDYLDVDYVRRELSSVVQRLVGACLHIHEGCQSSFLRICKRRHDEFQRITWRCTGLMGRRHSSMEDGAWGWETDGMFEEDKSIESINKYGGSVRKRIRDEVARTYEILEWIFEKSLALRIDSRVLACAAPPYTLSECQRNHLKRYDVQFSAQNLALEYVQKLGRSWDDIENDMGFLVKGVMVLLDDRQAWMSKVASSGGGQVAMMAKLSCTTLNTDQMLLYSSLCQLERALHKSRSFETENSPIPRTDQERLVRELAYVCGAFCPLELRIAATRCLGEIKTAVVADLSSAQTSIGESEWLEGAVESDQVLLTMQARCVECLAKSLKSPEPHVGLVAAETIQSVLSSGINTECLNALGDTNTYECLEPFMKQNKGFRRKVKVPDKIEMEALQVKCGLDIEEHDDLWCWNAKLWQCATSDNTFEEWVCRVTTALIFCCCSYPSERQKRSEHHLFLSLCRRICFLEQDFCVLVFPYLVLVLLNNGEERSDRDTSQRLSNAFGMLIASRKSSSIDETQRSCNNRANSKALSLVIDTLDLLRRISQHRFLCSRNHKRNKSPKKRAHKHGLPVEEPPPVPPWKGVPFGIMVSLDNLVVANACIRARRYASALFFLDLYLNQEFGRSSDMLNWLSDGARGRKDDFSSCASYEISNEGDRGSTRSRILLVLKILSECFEGMNEYENLEATKAPLTSIDFLGGSESRFNNEGYGGDSIDILRQLNNADMEVEGIHLRALDAMEDLGIRGVSLAFVDGLCCNRSLTINSAAMSKVRESWFRSYLSTARWENIEDMKIHHHSKGFVTKSTISGKFDEATHEPGFFESMSKAFGSFCFEDMESCRSLLLQARLSTLDRIFQTGTGESPLAGIVGHIEKLKAVSDLERLANGSGWQHILETDVVENGMEDTDVFARESKSSFALHGDTHMQGFTLKMPELIIRALRIKKSQNPRQNNELADLLESHLWKSSIQARYQKHFGLAQETIHRLRLFLNAKSEHEQVEFSQQLKICLEEANILECLGDFKSAIRMLGHIIDSLQLKEEREGQLDLHLDSILADSQIICGRWMARYRVRESTEVLKSFQQPGATRARRLSSSHISMENSRRTTKGFLEVATMASTLYETLISRTQSREYKQTSISILEQERELKQCTPQYNEVCDTMQSLGKKKKAREIEKLQKETSGFMIYFKNLAKDLTNKKDQRKKLLSSVENYLKLAITSFGDALEIAGTDQSDDMAKHVFRMTSLWFAQASGTNSDGSVDDIFAQKIERIPSFRFVSLAYQLFARIGSSPSGGSSFQRTLHALVVKMSSQHPYHTIATLIAMSNGKDIGEGVDCKNKESFLENVDESKVQAAKEIVDKLRSSSTDFVGNLVSSYEELIGHYNVFAYAPINDKHRGKKDDIRFSQFFTRSTKSFHTYERGCTPPCVFTAPPPVQADADYGSGFNDPVGGERIAGFKATFQIADGGVHKPKIMICIGTKGNEYRQLVKGNDDLRQDAIMSQVFNYVNSVVARHDAVIKSQSIAREQLRMVTYNVLPLSPASGVVEWVEDTLPFRDYIADRRTVGAHSRYYPGEWSEAYCRRHMEDAKFDERRKCFDEVCDMHSPVFRFFFIERFGHCMQKWHAAKMKFTRSVAVSSIVGHILGIGDRHTSNILVHETTGEVVHIDFGIVFEQGKLLTIPERVPFRLTRNMTDGMGPCGVEGAFVSAAEVTTSVLRSNASDLLTILSAVVSDPLYKWNISPVEAKRRQNSNSQARDIESTEGKNATVVETAEERNKDGAAALTKIKEKLQGYESGSVDQLGVESQVAFLVNAARDHDNLCQMFQGWMAWV